MKIGTPHTRNSGYLESRYSCDDKPVFGDVQTCPHCQSIIIMQTWKMDGGWCAKCDAPVCNNLACIAETARVGCVPFLKRLDIYNDSSVKFSQHLKIAGLEPAPLPASIIIP